MNTSRHLLTKAWRAFLLGGLFLGVAGLAQAQGRGWQADEVAGRLVDVAVLDADYQQPLPIYRHAARHERDRTSLTPPSREGCFLEDGTAHFHA